VKIPKFSWIPVIIFCGLALVSGLRVGMHAQGAPPIQRPGAAWGGYPYPPSTDAEVADPDVHRVLYQDENVVFMEVSNPPGLDVRMHGHPYPSVFVRDSGGGGGARGATANAAATTDGTLPFVSPGLKDTVLDPNSAFNGVGWGNGPAPQGMSFPTCQTSQPQAPHKPINETKVPLHFYRIEFKRLDADGIQTHWKEWYPWMVSPEKPVPDLVRGPTLGKNFSEKWPYPIAYDSISAAPNNYSLLFEDGHLRVLEVTVRPGETTPMHGHPYPAVIAYDSISGDPGQVTETMLDPASSLNGQGAGVAPPPHFMGMKVPTCKTMAPQAPHKIHNSGTVPVHYYRVEFKRIDGADFGNNWQKWYPWMMNMKYMR
jgi:hypothetical protein